MKTIAMMFTAAILALGTEIPAAKGKTAPSKPLEKVRVQTPAAPSNQGLKPFRPTGPESANSYYPRGTIATH